MKALTTLLLVVVRIGGLLALLLGVGYVAGYAPPLQLHMTLGAVVVLALWGLAVAALRSAAALAVVAIAWGLAVPALGMAQLGPPLAGIPWLAQVLHVIAALGAMGLAEALAKRRRAPLPA